MVFAWFLPCAARVESVKFHLKPSEPRRCRCASCASTSQRCCISWSRFLRSLDSLDIWQEAYGGVSRHACNVSEFVNAPHALHRLDHARSIDHTISYYIILYHTISYYIILYHYHTISYYIILYHTISYYIILYHTISYYIILYHAISYTISIINAHMDTAHIDFLSAPVRPHTNWHQPEQFFAGSKESKVLGVLDLLCLLADVQLLLFPAMLQLYPVLRAGASIRTL